MTLTVDHGGLDRFIEPVYNVSPNPGAAAKLGFSVGGIFGVQGDVTVRPGDYGLQTSFENVDESLAELDSLSLTVWGVPAAPIHDPLRWNGGVAGSSTGHFGAASEVAPVPFLTNPTRCETQPLVAEFSVTSWEQPNASESPPPTQMGFGPIVGCDRLAMKPSLTAETSTNATSAPTGLDVQTLIPQTYNNAFGLATPTLKSEAVTLPEGMTVNPSSGAGLQACSASQFAEEPVQEFSGPQQSEGHGCPAASKLATVRIATPSLAEAVTGRCSWRPRMTTRSRNPRNTRRLPAGGVPHREGPAARCPDQIRGLGASERGDGPADDELRRPAAATVSLATFAFNPGANAPLVTPPTCGLYTVTAALTPWSNPEGSPLTPEIPPFPIDANCPSGGVPPFAPQVTGGTENNAAGSFSPLYIRIERHDGEQEITGFSTALPPGLTGDLNGVAQCGEAEINAARAQAGVEAQSSPTCPPGSEIGHSIAEAGVGTVLAQTPGKLYLGGPYEGAPFSVVSVTSAKVGPFDLGTVVVHLPLQINPETAQVTIPSGAANQIPHIIKGIVIHLRTIRVYIDREHFMLNPTSCNPESLAATVIGSGTDLAAPVAQNPVTVSNPFQAADCSSLQFKPSVAVTTAGKASKANGASLTFKIAYPPNPIGSQSWFKYARFTIPKQLPARLTTLQKACLAGAFEHNRAACPAASVIGHARVHTPILPVPLEGPVYFVSYGGAKFPDAVLVLKGDGVTIELHGHTFIGGKTGVTSATFETLPDVPFESIEVSIPQGPFSEFGANLPGGRYDFCGQKLTVPTVFKAANGMELSQSTRASVTGCPTKASIASHKVKAHNVTLSVYVPAVGKLTAGGKGLSSATTRAAGIEDVTLTVHPKRRGKTAKRRIRLLFTPSHGRKQTLTIILRV